MKCWGKKRDEIQPKEGQQRQEPQPRKINKIMLLTMTICMKHRPIFEKKEKSYLLDKAQCVG